MSMLNLFILLFLLLLKKIKNPDALRLLKVALGVGTLYWSAIIVPSFFNVSPNDLPFAWLYVEYGLKILTTLIFFQTFKQVGKGPERSWILAMIVIAFLDILFGLVGMMAGN